uniref:Uncharacterized protein n=1 Tax=mine drainage metagenome TaxID=410659 RepID=E6QVQ7_9ZZZZ
MQLPIFEDDRAAVIEIVLAERHRCGTGARCRVREGGEVVVLQIRATVVLQDQQGRFVGLTPEHGDQHADTEHPAQAEDDEGKP